MDLTGLSIGIISYSIVLLIVMLLLNKNDLVRISVMRFVMLSALGHFLGGIIYYQYAIHLGADSVFYFDNATTSFTGTGYHFAFFALGYIKNYIVGDSFSGAFLFTSAIGFLGSCFYFLAYKLLLDRLTGNERYYLIDKQILTFPALVLLCWPSYFFWSSGLVKDSFAFICIGMFLYCVASGKLSFQNILLFVTSVVLGFLIRPYLFIIFSLTISIYMLLASRASAPRKILVVAAMGYAGLLLAPHLVNYAQNIESFGSITYVANYAIKQQQYMNIGSSIPVPTHDPRLMFLFLPYLILANLLLPLFVGASNIMGLIGSFENLYLLWLLSFFIKNRRHWKVINNSLPVVNLYMIYFLVGMSFLSMMNTNLGLAMREKMMYVPALLIPIMLVYAYRRILLLQCILDSHETESTDTSELVYQ